MSNRDEQFLDRWRSEKADYQRWGLFVAAHIRQLLVGCLDPARAKGFIRLPVDPRLKDDETLLQKAYYREKAYEDPYGQIEDKVGLRVVVLLEDDVRKTGAVIEREKIVWSAVKARDHEDEIAKNPYEFGYQSLHFVVRANSGNVVDELEIPADIPCEVQVRTLLQHAYSEVTHDTIYKPTVRATPEMKRAAAKSMALIEATGDYFHKLGELIAAQVAPLRALNSFLEGQYASLVGSAAAGGASPLNDLVLDRYGMQVTEPMIREWIQAHTYVGARIAARVPSSASFRIPAILLVYYCVDVAPYGTPEGCPLPEADLAAIYSDLGQSLSG